MSRNIGLAVLIGVALVLGGFYLLGTGADAELAEFEPDGHFKTMNAAELDPDRAEEIYEGLRADIRQRFGQSDDPSAKAFMTWKRFNTTPYRSATHGERYVNNYGNALAETYQRVKKGTPMPAGAILAKDSFAVTEDGDVYAQSLFLMEKLPPGSSKATADWRYVMVTPQGEIYGDTRGEYPEKMDFCHTCHRSVARSDYLFYIPEAYRVLQ